LLKRANSEKAERYLEKIEKIEIKARASLAKMEKHAAENPTKAVTIFV
jgi:hypothetical protein